MTFKDFGFDERLIEGIESSGYNTATPVQEQVIPLVLAGKDVIASAQTGTGKTAAFLLPLINKIITAPSNDGSITALVIVPTRELAVQIAQHMEGLSYFTSVSSIAVYGGGDGNAFVQEKKALSMGADIVICTPGKMIAHLNMGYVKFQNLKYLVLDEADRMLDMGFYDDLMRIINSLPAKRQNLLFSATMPHKIRELAKTILHQPAEINISISKPNEKIVQLAYVVYEPQKIPLVKYILHQKTFKSVLIFCSSKMSVKQLNRDLKKTGLPIDEIHSDLEQDVREDTLMKFKSGRLQILVATDILSRGIDIDNIDLVINYDVPHDGEDYVHRIGRTARAAAEGTAITFVSEKEQRKFASIEKLIGKPVPKAVLPEEFGEAPEYTPTAFRPKDGAGRNQKRPGGYNQNASRRSS
ncbi:MAG TPA: DEAD/DEAH box helicase [Ferruginibacter sp.]|nr:DEAD/DEAH box helicase [Ferruginibacter sp.]